jgi:Mn2+/Fe2+ NRAMP family transporter
VTVITAFLLVMGRYRFIETSSTVLVATFTAITIVNVILLQLHPTWRMTWEDFWSGLSFQLPQGPSGAGGLGALATALATFGIIGVGTNELLAYPYFCIEKGYARFTGPRDKTESWAARARGWMRVMRVDAWCSMVVYTFATVAFYILGASILGPIMLNPEGSEMIRTLAVMYEPIFGSYAPVLFLFGAIAVLYSTFFVANAGHARVATDVYGVIGGGKTSEQVFQRRVRILSGCLPFLCLFMYLAYPKPQLLVLTSGFLQNLMLPMLAGAAIYFRYKMADERVKPSPLWDAFLWLSALGLLIVAVWALANYPADFSRLMGW